MKNQLAVILVLALTAFLIWGCSEQQVNAPNDANGGISGTIQLSHTEALPLPIPLIAGQNTEVGVVNVWNDEDNLYVEFETTGDWCITETHVHVFLDDVDFTDIPTTKKGNPIPGQFDYSAEYDPCNQNPDPYVIPLEWNPCEDVYIAAHAVVVNQAEEITTNLVSGQANTVITKRRSGADADFTVLDPPTLAVEAWEPGPNYPNDISNDATWQGNSLWDQNVNNSSVLANGAEWIWESYRVVNPIDGTVITLETPLEIGYPVSGNILIAADNGYEVFLNGISLGSHGVYGDWRTSNLYQSFVPQDGWNVVGSYSLSGLRSGENILTIDAANEHFNTPGDPPNPYVGTASNNPGGVIFNVNVNWLETKTAWGCDDQVNCFEFPGNNWATYFAYTIQCPPPEVVNGGFEAPVVPNTTPTWNIYPSGTPGLGWTVEWMGQYAGAPSPANLEIQKSGTISGVSAVEGDQYAELDTDWDGPGSPGEEEASVKIYQLVNTCPGQDYTLTFWWSPRGGYDCSLEVWWDNELKASRSGNTYGWTSETITDLEGAGEYTRLEFRETGTPDSYGMFFDAVSVTLSPCQ